MKNTKELYISLYTVTIYSNFIVPLRSNYYTKLLYCGLQERFCFLLRQIRWFVWQTHTSEVGRNLDNNNLIKLEIGRNEGKVMRSMAVLGAIWCKLRQF